MKLIALKSFSINWQIHILFEDGGCTLTDLLPILDIARNTCTFNKGFAKVLAAGHYVVYCLVANFQEAVSNVCVPITTNMSITQR